MEEEFGQALADLRQFLEPETMAYLTLVLQRRREAQGTVDRSTSNFTHSGTSSLQSFSGSKSNDGTPRFEDQANRDQQGLGLVSLSEEKRKLTLPPSTNSSGRKGKTKERFFFLGKATPICSRLHPVCTKIVAKTGIKFPNASQPER